MAYPYQVPLPQPPKQHTLRVVLIAVGFVVVVCCGGAGIGGFFLYKGFKGIEAATGPAQRTAESFVTDLESDNADAAYALLCTPTRGSYTRDAFEQGLSKQPKIRSHQVLGVNVENVNGYMSATVSMDLTQDSGFTDQHTFTLVHENGGWKVCGQPY